ncbi:STAS domain-containing protein [Hoyosella sp. G463]|uniref:STAS domain-containing protein n=1 Tax=Lolliginicoccus lacisalsi TaxID=2742202 RepID=A0A927JBY5_9ACTN|nr:STAS domain-containing protein [Lolliginicoccus lacisalsi]MBD8506456.1 STAS domain-containing protein [Lolliginicoccus lacisalsi]
MGSIGTGQQDHAAGWERRGHGPREPVRLAVFQGELDATSHDELASTMRELLKAPDPIIVDLSGSRFCSASCIERIAEWAQRAKTMGIDFSIMAPRSIAQCFELFEPAPHVIPGHRPLTAGPERRFVHIYTV